MDARVVAAADARVFRAPRLAPLSHGSRGAMIFYPETWGGGVWLAIGVGCAVVVTAWLVRHGRRHP